jgi:hypothetical protein
MHESLLVFLLMNKAKAHSLFKFYKLFILIWLFLNSLNLFMNHFIDEVILIK